MPGGSCVLPKIASCPGCASGNQVLVGSIPAAIFFAGRKLAVPLEGGQLWRCRDCNLQYRFPRMEKRLLDELYRQGEEDVWQSPDDSREDWRYARGQIATCELGGEILDVGCFDGRFLASLGADWKKYGVEISPRASRIAESRGVSLLGSDFSALNAHEDRFAVVTAFDVIEHVEDPKAFLSQCANVLLPGGLAIISTGNTDSLPWKFHRSLNHYCICPEHISFINLPWCNSVADDVGLEVLESRSYRRLQAGWSRHAMDIAANSAFVGFPGLFAWLRRHGVGHSSHDSTHGYPPLWPTAKDHFAIVFQKRN